MVTIGEESARLFPFDPVLAETLPFALFLCHWYPRRQGAIVRNGVTQDVLKSIDHRRVEGGVLATRTSRGADPGGDELTRDAVFWEASELAELVELAASDDVKWVRDREAVANVLVTNVVFQHLATYPIDLASH
jgi:hypothetical protein